MSDEISESLKRVVMTSLEAMARATPGLKESCVNPPAQKPTGLETLAFGASIPFKGDKFHGCLAVSCTPAVLEASHPSIPLGLQVGQDGLADWCGEITNQIFGRIKNQLSDMNVHCSMETPMPLPPEGRTFQGPCDCKAVHLQYTDGQTPVMKVSLWIDLSLDESMEGLTAEAVDAGDVLLFSAAEGDTILF